MGNEYYDDEPIAVRRLAPAPATVIWGALMVTALGGAGATVWRGAAADERLVATSNENETVRRDLGRLAAERDQLAGRVAALERGVGEMKLALANSSAPETTGSIARPQAPAAAEPRPPATADARPAAFGLSLGAEASVEAARRRWTALSARYPQSLARLGARTRRGGGGGAFDLVAGPFATRQEADRACEALAEQGLACDTTAYAGDPLGRH